ERLTEIEDSRQHNEGAIREALASYKAFIEEAGNRMLEENRKLHSDLEMRTPLPRGADQMSEAAAFVRAYSDRAGPVCAAYAAKVLRDWAATLMRSHWDTDLPASVPFKANHAEFRSLVLSNFGRFVTPGGPPTPTTTAVPANAAVSAAAAAAAAAAASGMPVNAAAVAAALGEAASGDLQQASAFAIKPEPAPTGPPVTYATGNNPALPARARLAPTAASALAPSRCSAPYWADSTLLRLSRRRRRGGGAGSSGAGSIVGGGAPGSASPTQQNPKSSVASAAGAFRTGRCIPMTVRHRWGSLGSQCAVQLDRHGFVPRWHLGADREGLLLRSADLGSIGITSHSTVLASISLNCSDVIAIVERASEKSQRPAEDEQEKTETTTTSWCIDWANLDKKEFMKLSGFVLFVRRRQHSSSLAMKVCLHSACRQQNERYQLKANLQIAATAGVQVYLGSAGVLYHAQFTGCHRIGICHKDIKADNVLIDHRGLPQLADFGLAVECKTGRDSYVPNKRVTTMQYYPPECLLEICIPSSAHMWSKFQKLGRPLLAISPVRGLPSWEERARDNHWRSCSARCSDAIPAGGPLDPRETTRAPYFGDVSFSQLECDYPPDELHVKHLFMEKERH
uniref:Protein kinase domain-containing protein n=1 Tax=Macrostomum lignano TaxID=282301 RepID=A0A1I8FHZ4_9PLAT